MKKTGKIIAIIVVLALVAGGVSLFTGGQKNAAYSEEIARTQDISTYYTFSGNLSTKDSQIVTSTAKTTVKECLFSEGDAVKKNDIILKFSSGGTARAPMDGTLSNLYVEEGDEVTIGQQLLRVADYSNPQIVFNVDEYDRPALSVGQAADVTVLSTGKALTGTITRIAQEATVSGDLAYYEVTMTVPQDGTLAMGLSCEIRVLYQSVKTSLLCQLTRFSTIRTASRSSTATTARTILYSSA